jgi:LDH2 family malate/lactate/ureidoglycolate dehydrogenase
MTVSTTINLIMPVEVHNSLVAAAYQKRGYHEGEANQAAKFSELSAWHGIKTHNALKALHLDHLFGSATGGCVPGAEIEKLDTGFKAVQAWDAHKKLGQAVAFEAMDAAMAMADEYGSGTVSVDNAFHYLWGGGYVLYAADKGYIAYTNCTATLAEVVPFGGKFPTLGTNPHSWAFPTKATAGFNICIDWATSTVAMGRVQQFIREGKQLPPGAAVDADGNETRDPSKAKSLLPFGAHKGYGMSLLNELYGAYAGGSTPTIRSRPDQGPADEKYGCNFYFQVIKPEALAVGFQGSRTQDQNVQVVLDDILGHGNLPPEGRAMLPGKIEADNAALSEKHGGLLFTQAEVDAFGELAEEAGVDFTPSSFKTVDL